MTFGSALVTGLAVLCVAFLTPATYRTTALVVLESKGDVKLPEPLEASRRLHEAVLDRKLLEELSQERAPSAEPDVRAQAASSIRNALEVSTSDARTFSIAYRDGNSARVQRICNQLARRAAELAPHVLAPENHEGVEAERKRLAQMQNLVAFLAAHPEVAVPGPAAKPGGSEPDPAMRALIATQDRLRLQLAELAKHRGSAGPPNPYADPEETDEAAIKRRIAQIDATIILRKKALERQAGAQPKVSPELEAEWKRLLASLAETPSEARPAPAPKLIARVEREAPRPGWPIEPNRKLMLLLGAFGSLFVGLVAWWAMGGLAPRPAKPFSVRPPAAPPSPSAEPPAPPRDPAPLPAPFGGGAQMPFPNVQPMPPPAAAAPTPPAWQPPPAQMVSPPPQAISEYSERPAFRRDLAPGGYHVAQGVLLPPPAGPSMATPTIDVGGGSSNSGSENASARPSRRSRGPHGEYVAVIDTGPAERIPPEQVVKPKASRFETIAWGRPRSAMTQPLGSFAAPPELPPRSPLPPPPELPPRSPPPPSPERSSSSAPPPGKSARVPPDTGYRFVSSSPPAPERAPEPPPMAEAARPSTALARTSSRPPPRPRAPIVDVVHMTNRDWQPNPRVNVAARRELRDQLFPFAIDGCFVVAVVGVPEATVQKSAVAAELALALAESAHPRTLLLEGDLQRPAVHRMMRIDMPLPSGFSQQLHARVHGSPKPMWTVVACADNLHVLAEGMMRAPGLILSNQFEESVRELRSFYDFIIIDGPLTSGEVDCRAIDAVVDGIVVVSPKPNHAALARTLMLFSEKRFSSAVYAE